MTHILLFDLFLVTNPWRMLAAPYYGRNWSVCMESRTGNMFVTIDQHDMYGVFLIDSVADCSLHCQKSSHRDHLTGKKTKFGVQFFLDRVNLVQLFIRSSA